MERSPPIRKVWGGGSTDNLHPNSKKMASNLPVTYSEAVPIKTVAMESCSILNAWLLVEVVVAPKCSSRYFGGCCLSPQQSHDHDAKAEGFLLVLVDVFLFDLWRQTLQMTTDDRR